MLGRLYQLLMILLAVLLLGFYLACTATGVIALCFYDDPGGLGLMVVGVLLYFGGRLALSEVVVRRA